jgi:hypothetical protein
VHNFRLPKLFIISNITILSFTFKGTSNELRKGKADGVRNTTIKLFLCDSAGCITDILEILTASILNARCLINGPNNTHSSGAMVSGNCFM